MTYLTGVSMVFKQVPCIGRGTCPRREASEDRDSRSVLLKASAYLRARASPQPLFSDTVPLDKY